MFLNETKQISPLFSVLLPDQEPWKSQCQILAPGRALTHTHMQMHKLNLFIHMLTGFNHLLLIHKSCLEGFSFLTDVTTLCLLIFLCHHITQCSLFIQPLIHPTIQTLSSEFNLVENKGIM